MTISYYAVSPPAAAEKYIHAEGFKVWFLSGDLEWIEGAPGVAASAIGEFAVVATAGDVPPDPVRLLGRKPAKDPFPPPPPPPRGALVSVLPFDQYKQAFEEARVRDFEDPPS